MRWVVAVFLLAGCFTKPGLRDRDGGGNSDGGNDDDGGGGDGGLDAPIVGGCENWGAWSGPIAVFANGPERFGPWLSPDALVLVFQSGTAVLQVERAAVGVAFGSALTIYNATSSNDLQPFLSDDLKHLWIDDNSGGLLEASRITTTALFSNATPLPGPISAISDTVEDVAVSGDGLRMIITSGPSAQNEDLYMSSRSMTTQQWGALSASLSINAPSKNDCCAAITPTTFLWTRETPTGGYEIREVGWNGDGQFAGAGAPIFATSEVWHSPAISRDGKQLVAVRNAPPNRDLYQMNRVCMDP